jgi:allantoate deiminase
VTAAVKELVAQIDELGLLSDAEGELSRTFLSPAAYEAMGFVGHEMEAVGLKVMVDPAANVIGQLRSKKRTERTLVVGSHIDTVHNAGRFDGALGVLVALAALKELKRRRVELPFNVEVAAFSEEEGVRFGCGYIGSAAYTGQLTDEMLDRTDADGVTVEEAMDQIAKGAEPIPVQERCEPIGYVEVHIEQGPVLERANLAVGVVTGIAGQSRFQVTFTGEAGHAGTTPMAGRRDALAAAAEFVLAVEKYASARRPPFVATVGAASVQPGAPNVIPGQVMVSLDVRDVEDRTRHDAIADLRSIAEAIASRRKIRVAWDRTQDNPAVACDSSLMGLLEQSVQQVQGRSLSLASGAGHDGVVISRVMPIAMLFVRCRNGLSHHPDEYASPADIGVALDVLVDFLLRLAAQPETPPLPAPRQARPAKRRR